MNYVGKLLSNFKGFYNEINSATLTGAIDVIIVQQEDGSFLSSPWHVRFGKMGVLRSREKVVDIEINGEPVQLHMKLGEAGEAFFVQQAPEEEDGSEMPAYLATSPIPDSLELMELGLNRLKQQQSQQEQHEQQEKDADDLTPRQTITVVLNETTGEATKFSAFVAESRTAGLLSPQSTSSEGSHEALRQPVPKACLDISTQTDMSGLEAENKHKTSTSRTRLHSGESSSGAASGGASGAASPQSKTHDTSNADTQTAMSVSKDVVDSVRRDLFKTDSSKTDIKQLQLTKSKRRRKRKGAMSPNRSKSSVDKKTSTSSLATTSSTHLEVVSVASGSSGDVPVEEALFEMDLSDGENVDMLSMMSMGRTVSMPLIEEKHARTNEWANVQYASAFHPFSDGDITPVVSPRSSRPPSPKSDTEYETQKKNIPIHDATCQTQLTGDNMETIDDVQWRWGELPQSSSHSVEPTSLTSTRANQEDDKPSGGLFQFMRKTKKMRHQPEQEGIYLDDLKLEDMDPEVAALYLYNVKSPHQILMGKEDEDSESGRGASLPQSPITVERDGHELLKPSSHLTNLPEVAMSMCGGLKDSDEVPTQKFMQYLVTYEDICNNPNLVADPNLVVRFGDKYYNWQIAGPILAAVSIFQRPLPEGAVEALVKQHMPKKERKRGWMWWGRSPADTTQSSTHTSAQDAAGANATDPSTKHDVGTSPLSSAPNSPQKKRNRKHKDDGSSTDDESDTSLQSHQTKATDSVHVEMNEVPKGAPSKVFLKKSLKLTTEQIEQLNLRAGVNEVAFSVTTQYQGTTLCNCNIYMWKWDDRIIISDIDGTITKSDVLGQLMPMIGKDWSQAGIASLYNLCHQNGYKFLYLSARAIGQSKITRDYLKGVRQGALQLPDGPLLLSPSSLISAFHREVIERKPEEFKISCLRDIQALFPSSRNPFYAGFGNKINDVWAYRAVNIPISRVFTVNHKGELRHELNQAFQSTYTKMMDLVDHLFPPLLDASPNRGRMTSGNFPAPDEFSHFTYWRDPVPEIDTEISSFLKTTSEKK